MPKPKNWRQIQKIRWQVYKEFKCIIEDFFNHKLRVETDLDDITLTCLKETLLDTLKKATEIYHA